MNETNFPPQKRYQLEFPSGRATYTVRHLMAPVPVKIHAFGRVLRGKDGSARTENVSVPSTRITLKLASGETIKAESHCKPPDLFDPYLGEYHALQHLAREQSAKKRSRELSKADCGALFEERAFVVKKARESLARATEAKARQDGDFATLLKIQEQKNRDLLFQIRRLRSKIHEIETVDSD